MSPEETSNRDANNNINNGKDWFQKVVDRLNGLVFNPINDGTNRSRDIELIPINGKQNNETCKKGETIFNVIVTKVF